VIGRRRETVLARAPRLREEARGSSSTSSRVPGFAARQVSPCARTFCAFFAADRRDDPRQPFTDDSMSAPPATRKFGKNALEGHLTAVLRRVEQDARFRAFRARVVRTTCERNGVHGGRRRSLRRIDSGASFAGASRPKALGPNGCHELSGLPVAVSSPEGKRAPAMRQEARRGASAASFSRDPIRRAMVEDVPRSARQVRRRATSPISPRRNLQARIPGGTEADGALENKVGLGCCPPRGKKSRRCRSANATLYGDMGAGRPSRS